MQSTFSWKIKGISFNGPFPRITFKDAMDRYGTDKPDIRFGMEISEITGHTRGRISQYLTMLEYVGEYVRELCHWYP
jgi:aspartyl-tRNA synthetase